MIAGLVGFVLAMVNIFKKQVSPGLIMAYAARRACSSASSAPATRASTAASSSRPSSAPPPVFAAVLFGYKSGRLRATPKFVKVVTFGLIGLVAVVLLNLIASPSAPVTRSA
jgi:uncharacterized YccA/Bax inhibitor family protein